MHIQEIKHVNHVRIKACQSGVYQSRVYQRITITCRVYVYMRIHNSTHTRINMRWLVHCLHLSILQAKTVSIQMGILLKHFC